MVRVVYVEARDGQNLVPLGRRERVGLLKLLLR